ncbi:MAG: sigma-70 family RNA polymerase sigma factor [Anaerolineae bacterium]
MSPPIVSPSTLACDAEAINQAIRVASALLTEPGRPLPDPYQAASEIDRLIATLAHNMAAGRYRRACRQSGSSSLSLFSYARRVAMGLAAEWDRVAGLRRGEPALWTALAERLERKAYFWHGPAGRSGWAHSEASEVVANACADLWCWLQAHPYFFDVPFERWAARLLLNRLLAAARSRKTAARHIVDSLDRPLFESELTVADALCTDRSQAGLERFMQREALGHALHRLGEREAQVVCLWYLEGWPAAEIATRLRVTVGCVYLLKHRALRKLRADPMLSG